MKPRLTPGDLLEDNAKIQMMKCQNFIYLIGMMEITYKSIILGIQFSIHRIQKKSKQFYIFIITIT